MLLPALVAILIGLGMIGQWARSYMAQEIPELQSEPYRIGFHIAGEMVTALLLIGSGGGLLLDASWAPALYLIATGMLIYTAMVSPGYFAQHGDWTWLWIFGAILILAVVSAVIVATGSTF